MLPIPPVALAVDPLTDRLRRRITALASATSRPAAIARELLDVFRASLETHLASVAAATDASDADAARAAAHALIGPSGYLLIEELETSCRALERLSAQCEPGWIDAARAVGAQGERVKSALGAVTLAPEEDAS